MKFLKKYLRILAIGTCIGSLFSVSASAAKPVADEYITNRAAMPDSGNTHDSPILELETNPNVKTASLSAGSKLHFISLTGDSDAILLESNGHFGMIDSGEDNDFPDGSDPKYPFREGITKYGGYETQVKAYLDSLGIKKLDFYIATHAHSDHIGSADEILRWYEVDKLYIGYYDDSIAFDKLWDNQYVYDHAISAAKDRGTEIIQDFTVENTKFALGDIELQLLNYDKPTHITNLNNTSICVKATSNGQSAFFSADIDNRTGLEDKLAPQIGKVNLLKMAHHGADGSNSYNYLATLDPDICILTGTITNMVEKTFDQLYEMDCAIYSTWWSSNSVLGTMTKNGIKVEVDKTKYLAYVYSKNKWYYMVDGHIVKDEGWITNLGKSYYISKDGSALTGWQTLDDVKYYFDSSGAMATDWFKDKDDWYYADSSGLLAAKGWLKLDSWYYFDETGKGKTGWFLDANDWYYFTEDCRMKTGVLKEDDKIFVLDESGRRQNDKWYFADNNWYYLNKIGEAQTGWNNLSGKWYYMDQTAKMQTGWLLDGQTWYFLDESGAMISDQLSVVNGNTYYFAPNGHMLSGWVFTDGKWYYMDNSGGMQTGWLLDGETWYFLDETGTMMSNCFVSIDNNWYFFDFSGKMVTGWEYTRGSWYYMNSDGSRYSGWLTENGIWYYLNKDGIMICNSTVLIDGALYQFNNNGICQNPYASFSPIVNIP